MNEPLYFYFLGNRFIYEEDDFVPGTSTSCSFDIIDQRDIDNLPVISTAISEEDFTGEGTYHGFFQNKGALVMFNVNTLAEGYTHIQGMTNFVVVDFAQNKFTTTAEADGEIWLPGGSGERWAILLPQNAVPAGPQGSAYSGWDYIGKCGAVPAIVANGYYVDGIPVNITTPTGYGNPPDAPTNVTSSISGSSVKVQWDWVDEAESYYVYKSSTANGQYLLIGSTYGTSYYDNEPGAYNYYKVRAANYFGQSDLSDYTYCFVPAPEGAINGRFTINANGDKVYFSNGNLVYNISNNTWMFATQQYWYANIYNENIGQSYASMIDLFGWGTSGWNNGNTYYQPYDYEATDYPLYGYGYGPTDGSYCMYNLTGAYAQADWGVHNAITNGGNQAGLWRTLTAAEFSYLLNQRTTATGARFARVTLEFLDPSFSSIHQKYGLLLLPDDWDGEYFLNANNYAADNVINSEDDFITLQEKGVVFLPCAGERIGTEYTNDDKVGYYWTSSTTGSGTSIVFYMNYTTNEGGSTYNVRHHGCSVRLVQDVQ